MQISLIAVGTKMPDWVQAGYGEYAKRLASDCRLTLVEIPAIARSKSTDPGRAKREEGDRMARALPKNATVMALDVTGKMYSTESLAELLGEQMAGGRDLALLVGGADGLSAEILARADSRWSLSRLTFPHPLVRVILAEQLYRAHSLLRNHPYHRA